jgi:hypothetical protein
MPGRMRPPENIDVKLRIIFERNLNKLVITAWTEIDRFRIALLRAWVISRVAEVKSSFIKIILPMQTAS